jgi:hypothetical protein
MRFTSRAELVIVTEFSLAPTVWLLTTKGMPLMFSKPLKILSSQKLDNNRTHATEKKNCIRTTEEKGKKEQTSI